MRVLKMLHSQTLTYSYVNIENSYKRAMLMRDKKRRELPIFLEPASSPARFNLDHVEFIKYTVQCPQQPQTV